MRRSSVMPALCRPRDCRMRREAEQHHRAHTGSLSKLQQHSTDDFQRE